MFFNNKKDIEYLIDMIENFPLYQDEKNTIVLSNKVKNKDLKKLEEKIIMLIEKSTQDRIKNLKVYGEIMIVCEKLSDGFTDDRIVQESNDEKINLYI